MIFWPHVLNDQIQEREEWDMKAKVYFTKEITPEKVVEMYQALGVELPGKVAVKVHSGRRETRISFGRNSGGPWLRRSRELLWNATLLMEMPAAASGIIQSLI